MSMMQLRHTAPNPNNPFQLFICSGCGKPLGEHFLFRPDKLRDVFALADSPGRKPNGKLYCHRDQVGYAGAYYQRQMRRTMVEGYSGKV